MEYSEIFDFAYDLAEKASKIILEASAKRWVSTSDLNEKKNSVDLVTETDELVERMIKSAVAEKYPHHKFIGEESFAAGDRSPLTDEFTWIGTMNPFVACSIGVAHMTRPVVGVIALPFLNQIFSARLGGGAYMNRNIPLPLTGGIPQPLSDLSRWGSDRGLSTFKHKTSSFVKLAGDPRKGVDGGVMAHALRTTGSTACNAVAVAAGQLDIYWMLSLGRLPIILNETGGLFAGGKDSLDAPVGQVMMGRRYIFVRAVPATEVSIPSVATELTLQSESPSQIQHRLARELYDVVDEWTNEDMMD
ncbi:hypothetical protein I312_105017 [Cryptococcus bacillisporus CA1280]|uniref:uncharacterized protein n=1 Tax=Cryptococcus bacillisporus CA1280 TaxID=1296109 RepID=UPI0033667CBA